MSTERHADPTALPEDVDLPTGQAIVGEPLTEPNRYAVPFTTLVAGAHVSFAEHVIEQPVSSHGPSAAPSPGLGDD